jgi:hypothetical protein
MGMDFIDKTKGNLKKGWDRSRAALSKTNLLTKFPEAVNRSLLADAVGDAPIAVGDRLVIQFHDSVLMAFRELTPAARFCDPPDDVLQMVRDAGGCANGVVATVYDVSRTLSITLR